MKLSIFGLLISLCSILNAQKQLTISFIPKFNGADLVLNQTCQMPGSTQNFRITDFNWYVSRMEVIHDGGQVTIMDTNLVALVKMDSRLAISLGSLQVNVIEGVRFKVGVPIHLNHLDISLYAPGHPLSFQTPAMHWGWTSGYMHHIVSGYADQGNNGTFETSFEIHSLGDHNVHDVEIMSVATPYPNNEERFFINVNVDEWLNTLDAMNCGIQHGDNGIHDVIMGNILTRNVFEAPQTASINDKVPSDIHFLLNTEKVIVSSDEAQFDQIQVLSLNGAILLENQVQTNTVELKKGDLPSNCILVVKKQGAVLLSKTIFW